MNVQARYGVDPDREVLEILQSAAKSKKVMFLQQPLNCHVNCLFFFIVTCVNLTQKGKESVRKKTHLMIT
jgi:hypothetical protein